jgi:hypothetical protein
MIPRRALKRTRRPQPHLLPSRLRTRRAQPIHVLHVRRIHQHHRHPRSDHLFVDEPPIGGPEVAQNAPIPIAELHIGLDTQPRANGRQSLQRARGLPSVRSLGQFRRVNQEQPYALIALAHEGVAIHDALHHAVRRGTHSGIATRLSRRTLRITAGGKRRQHDYAQRRTRRAPQECPHRVRSRERHRIVH